MKSKDTGLSWQYQVALRRHLQRGRPAGLKLSQDLGRRAVALGLETLDVARIHERALIELVLPSCAAGTRAWMVRRAGTFFARAITPIEKTHRVALETNTRLEQLNHKLGLRRAALASSNRRLKHEISRRNRTEQALRDSQKHYALLLDQSRLMQEQLRFMSRQLLFAQEEERKKISRELHDVIAQTLTSINVRLATLKKEASINTKGLERTIARTQELVERSVRIVHRFARELRPTVLDDLGLIPALHTFMKHFREQTGIRVSLSSHAAANKVNSDKRTVLFRVAQESLANVARHAHASQAGVRIQKLHHAICMTIHDNGKGFREDSTRRRSQGKRLGLLGMRERLEMVGGNLTVKSTLGRGTRIIARIPIDEAGGGE
jgi:signal transduction histidine kinase